MLSDQELQLLTAFVDGELTQNQRRAVMRLLEISSEARAMLKQLQENVHKLKQLAQHKIKPSLVEGVLQAIADQRVQPRPAAPRRRPWLPYVAGVIAATVLIVVFEIVYWKTVSQNPGLPKGPGPDISKKIVPVPNPVEPRKKENPHLATALAITEGMYRDFSNYVPPKPYEVFFGDLAKADSKVTGEFTHTLNLNSDRSVHIEITVNNNDAAMMRLRDALMERHIKLVADPAVNKILKSKVPGQTEFLVYAENLTTDDVAKLMRELSHQYVVGQGMNQKMVDSPYKKLAVAAGENEDLQAIAKLFGVKVSALELKERKDSKVTPKNEREAVVLPTTAAGPPSQEVRSFLNQRPAPQPGTLQVIIKIRQE